MVSPSKKRLLAVVAVIGLASVVFASLRVILWSEPQYQGRALHSWLADLDVASSDPPDRANAAARAVRTIGTNAFPWLARMLRTEDPFWKRAALALNAQQHFLQLPVVPANVLRAQALDGYGALGPAAVETVPLLIEMLRSEQSPQVRACVAVALGRIGPPAKAAIPMLLSATLDSNIEVRNAALIALGNIQRWNLEPLRFEMRRFP